MAAQAKELLKLARELYSAAEEINVYHQILEYTGKSTAIQEDRTIFPMDGSPTAIRDTERAITELTTKIQILIASPQAYLNQQAINAQHLACLRWLCHFRIVTAIPFHGSVSYIQVAQATKVPLVQLKTIGRMAMTAGFLTETEPGMLSHSSMSRAFANDPSLIDWALICAEVTATSAGHMVEATEKFNETSSKSETSFNIANDTDLPFFEYLKSNPRMTSLFASYMKNITNTEATSLKHILVGYDWSSLGSGTVVDVGGSSGHATLALAEAFPALHFVIQDLPGTLETSALDVSKLKPEFASRVSFQSHDFFTRQPVRDAAAYFLRTIIHDWPLKEAGDILKQIRDAMSPGRSRLLIMDIVMSSPGSTPLAEETLARHRDLTMMQTFNAKEREIDDWEALIATVSNDLRIECIRKPPGSSMSIIEIVRVADSFEAKSN